MESTIPLDCFLRRLFSDFNNNSIDYFVYGSYQSLPVDTGGSDIDFIIAEKDIAIVEQILRNVVSENDITIASYYENSSANAKFYRLLTHSWGVQLDLCYKGLSYRGVTYYPEEYLHNNIFIHNELVRVLDEKRGYFANYFKETIHNGRVKEKYISAVIEAFNKKPIERTQEIKELFGDKAARIISTDISVAGLQANSKLLRTILRNRLMKKSLFSFFKTNFLNIIRLFSKCPGYCIVVEGTDGSGKSTIINHITPILNGCFHNTVYYSHLRPKAIPDLGVILGKKSADEPELVNSDPHGQSQSGFLGSLIRWGYYMIDYTFGYLKKVWIQIHSKSKVFIFDRYYYDYYIDQKRSRTNLPNWILRFGEMLIAKPDLILCLGGDPEKIYARKPETSLQEVERQTNVLRHFCETHHNAVWIDTTTTIEQSCDDAMQAIVSMMSKRFN